MLYLPHDQQKAFYEHLEATEAEQGGLKHFNQTAMLLLNVIEKQRARIRELEATQLLMADAVELQDRQIARIKTEAAVNRSEELTAQLADLAQQVDNIGAIKAELNDELETNA